MSTLNGIHPSDASLPETLPLTIEQYEKLVELGTFAGTSGQIELINGRIVRMNPQGPEHSDPMDYLNEWSVLNSRGRFTIRVEKPIRIPSSHSCPEPDLAWVSRRRYVSLHPSPADVQLLIEVSFSSSQFDTSEKQQLYATAEIVEYWQVDVRKKNVTVYRLPQNGTYTLVVTLDNTMSLSPQCAPDATLHIKDLFVTE
jgi:Uma2 family endonuclease